MHFFSKVTLVAGAMFLLPFSLQAANCPKATTASSASFCSSFKTAAECHCIGSGLRRDMCSNQDLLYKRMIATFGSLQRACEYQHDTSTQECIDDWNCYRAGGMTSNSELCNSTGAACH